MNREAVLFKYISQSKQTTIVIHAQPDGDAIGSSLALKELIRKLGGRAEVYCCDKYRQ